MFSITYMKKTIAFCALSLACAAGFAAVDSKSRNLQQLCDDAALTTGKRLALSGDYFLEAPLMLTEKHSGISIDGGGKTRIIGGRKIEGWQRDGAFFKAVLPENSPRVTSLFVNGKRAVPARSTQFSKSSFVCGLAAAGDAVDGVYKIAFDAFKADADALLKLNDGELKDAAIDMYFAWVHTRYAIDSVSENPDGKTVRIVVKTDSKFFPFNFGSSWRYHLTNLKSALDAEGEFYYSSAENAVYYFPRRGETPEGMRAYFGVVPTVMEVGAVYKNNKTQDITVRGIEFVYGADPSYSKDGMIKFLGTQGASFAHSFIKVFNTKSFILLNCKISHCDGYAVGFEDNVWGSRVENCEIYDAGCGGVRLGRSHSRSYMQAAVPPYVACGNNLVRNNIIYSYGRRNYSGCGVIIFDSGGNIVENNAIFDGFYTGVSVGWTWGNAETRTHNNLVRENKIFKIGQGYISDMGGIYTLGSSQGSKIYGNEIHDIERHKYGAWGIYNDAGSSKFEIYNNYVHDTQDCGYFMNYGSDVLVRNNVFVNGRTSQVGLGQHGENSFTFRNNIVYYSSPAPLLRDGKLFTPEVAKFAQNLYYDTSEDVKFGSLTFAEWQATGQDESSVVEDPDLKNWSILNPQFMAIGFKLFTLESAGLQRDMKKRYNSFIGEYKYPPRCEDPEDSPYGINALSDFSNHARGDAPRFCQTMCDPKKRDIRVLITDDGEAYLRMEDSDGYKESYKPAVVFKPRIINGWASVEFALRLNADTQIRCQVRGSGEVDKTPLLDFAAGAVSGANGPIPLPVGKWLNVRMKIGVGKNASQNWSWEIDDGEKTVAQEDAAYEAKPLKAVDWVGFLMTGASECSANLKNVSIFDAEECAISKYAFDKDAAAQAYARSLSAALAAGLCDDCAAAVASGKKPADACKKCADKKAALSCKDCAAKYSSGKNSGGGSASSGLCDECAAKKASASANACKECSAKPASGKNSAGGSASSGLCDECAAKKASLSAGAAAGQTSSNAAGKASAGKPASDKNSDPKAKDAKKKSIANQSKHVQEI